MGDTPPDSEAGAGGGVTVSGIRITGISTSSRRLGRSTAGGSSGRLDSGNGKANGSGAATGEQGVANGGAGGHASAAPASASAGGATAAPHSASNGGVAAGTHTRDTSARLDDPEGDVGESGGRTRAGGSDSVRAGGGAGVIDPRPQVEIPRASRDSTESGVVAPNPVARDSNCSTDGDGAGSCGFRGAAATAAAGAGSHTPVASPHVRASTSDGAGSGVQRSAAGGHQHHGALVTHTQSAPGRSNRNVGGAKQEADGDGAGGDDVSASATATTRSDRSGGSERSTQSDGEGRGGRLSRYKTSAASRARMLARASHRRLVRSSFSRSMRKSADTRAMLARHQVVSWWVILPNSSLAHTWEVLVLLPLLYTCTLLPFVVCFVEEEIEPWITLDWIVTTAFALDMCVSFVSAYRNKHKKLVTNGRDIALHYLRGWFWIDLVATFPFGELSNSTNSNQLVRLSRLPRVFRLLRLVRLVRLVRAAKLRAYIHRLEVWFSLTPSFARFFQTMFWATMVTHLAGSLWHFIALQQGVEDSWIADAELVDASLAHRYVASVYWAFATLTSVGYGDIKAVTNLEMAFSILVMGVGLMWAGLMVGNIMSIVSMLDRASARQASRVADVARLVRAIPNMSDDVRYTLQEWAEAPVVKPRASRLDIVRQLPVAVRQPVVYYMWKDTIQRNAVLSKLCPSEHQCSAVAELLFKGEVVTVEAGKTLHESGAPCRHLFLLVNGQASVALDGTVIATRNAGTMLGLAETMFSSTYVTTSTALEKVEAVAITRQEVHVVLQAYPKLKLALETAARRHVEMYSLPVRLPPTEADLKLEAVRARQEALRSAVKGGLWRKFALKDATDASGLQKVANDARASPRAHPSGNSSGSGSSGSSSGSGRASGIGTSRSDGGVAFSRTNGGGGGGGGAGAGSDGVKPAKAVSLGPSVARRAVSDNVTAGASARAAAQGDPVTPTAAVGPSGAPLSPAATTPMRLRLSQSARTRRGSDGSVGSGSGAGAAGSATRSANRRRGSKQDDVLLALMNGQRALTRLVKTTHQTHAETMAMLADQIDSLSTTVHEVVLQLETLSDVV